MHLLVLCLDDSGSLLDSTDEAFVQARSAEGDKQQHRNNQPCSRVCMYEGHLKKIQPALSPLLQRILIYTPIDRHSPGIALCQLPDTCPAETRYCQPDRGIASDRPRVYQALR